MSGPLPDDPAPASFRLPVEEPSQVGEARRQAGSLARRLGLSEEDAGRAALMATELGTNLLKHAGGGELLLRALRPAEPPGVELIGVDSGPGIRDLAAALRDGASTAGTAGTGLGSLRRMADAFDLHTVADKGTSVVARVWRRGTAGGGALECGAVCVAHPHEERCGDAWDVMVSSPERAWVMVVDGLGHGPAAHEAAQSAVRPFRGAAGRSPAEMVLACHQALRHTRGAALAVAELDRRSATVRFASVGNVAGCVYSEERPRMLPSQNGTAGQGTIKVRQFESPWPADGMLLMWSDGLAPHWGALEAYPGLPSRPLGLLASLLYRDHARGRDDATVVAIRHPGGPTP